jgi:hypothetical protein
VSKILLQWETWVYGLLAGFIGGGANAVIATFTACVIAPDKFNVGTQIHNFLVLLGATFLTSGVLSAMAYLSKSPLPSIVTTTTTETEKIVTPTDDGVKIADSSFRVDVWEAGSG